MRSDTPDLALLESFLAHEERPGGTLSLMQVQGMLFAFAGAPETVPLSDMLEVVFNGEEAGFSDLEEVQGFIDAFLAVSNRINREVTARAPVLPEGCTVRDDPMANFETDAPLSQWAAGFQAGFGHVGADWDEWLPEDVASDFNASVMVLSLFASRERAERFRGELEEDGTTLERVAQQSVTLFQDAMEAYAHLGRSIHEARLELEDEERRRAERFRGVGRNDPCPCGSGKKLKKCCGKAAR